jgi:hypothetical protein
VQITSHVSLVGGGEDSDPADAAIYRSVRADYERSLRRRLSLDADVLCEGHFGVLVGKDEVRDFIDSYR